MLITVNPSIDMISDQQPSVFYLDDGTAVFKCIGSPEGAIEANAGSWALSTNGLAYLKTTMGGNTGWRAHERVVAVDVSNTTTVGTGLDPLTSLTIPANTLVTDGQRLNVVADGNFNGAAGNKRLTLIGDGFTILDTGLIAINNSNWHLELQALRVSSVGLLLTARLSTNGFGVTSTPVFLGGTGFQTPNFAAAYVLQCLGECANGADSVSQGSFVASVL